MTDLKQRLAAVLASSNGKAMIEEGQQFSIEELKQLPYERLQTYSRKR
jgi:hypothetical protein